MRRLVTLMIAASALALPSAALAQNAGDEQYADPFGQVQDQGGGQSQQNEAPAQSAPAPAAPAQTTTSTATTGEAVASQDTSAPALPRTGLPAGLLAGTGVLLLTAGTTLRRRFS
jgi:hypothetical protein